MPNKKKHISIWYVQHTTSPKIHYVETKHQSKKHKSSSSEWRHNAINTSGINQYPKTFRRKQINVNYYLTYNWSLNISRITM